MTTINDERINLEAGDFLFIDRNNIIRGEFIENTALFTIHAPSITDDKVKLNGSGDVQ